MAKMGFRNYILQNLVLIIVVFSIIYVGAKDNNSSSCCNSIENNWQNCEYKLLKEWTIKCDEHQKFCYDPIMSQPNQHEINYKPSKRFNFMNENASTEQNGRNMKNYSMTNDSTLQEEFFKQFGDGLFMEDILWKDLFTEINQTMLENKITANKTKNPCEVCCYCQENNQGRNDWTRMCVGTVNNEKMNRLFVPQLEEDCRYVLASWNGLCGGLGNQMWRFASLYGIGKPYGRRPIYTEEQRCLKKHGPHESEGEDEISNLFPVMAAQLQYIKLKPEETFVLNGFAEHCCRYDDPQRVNFSRFKQKYVQITSNYFQSYKFFEARRHEIRQIFQFSPNVCSTVKIYSQQIFSNDNAHKLCVHTRLGDFNNLGLQSKTEFTEKSIEFAHDILQKKSGNVSIVLMGAEKHFLKNLNINRKKIHAVYLPKAMPRGNDLAFATVACDSLLITASSSTFAWWMGYLMPDGATVFYDSDLDHTHYSRENFLPEWTPIRLENGVIIFD